MRRAALAMALGLVAVSSAAQAQTDPSGADDEAQLDAAKAAAAEAAAAAAATEAAKTPAEEAPKAAEEAPKAAEEAPKATEEAPKAAEEAPKAAEEAPKAAEEAPGNAEGLPEWGAADLPAWDAGAGATPGHELIPNWDAVSGPSAASSFPWIEHHGYFRTRADLFYNFDLDTYSRAAGVGSSPVRPPLTELDESGPGHPESATDETFETGSDSLAGANIRLRYEPTVHVSETLRINATLDVLDNLVLGTTPASQLESSNIAIDDAGAGQETPVSGVNGFNDSIKVKRLWGEWRTALGLISFGRMPHDWGMGIFANPGNDLDSDFGDHIDRIMGVATLLDTYLALSWDFPDEGLSGFDGLYDLSTQSAGQAHDLDQRDDITQIMVSAFSKPFTLEEKSQRAQRLDELREPVWDWGVYTLFRHRDLTDEVISDPAASPDDVRLREVESFVFIPDLWGAFEYRPDARTQYRLEVEAVALIGSIDEVPQKASEPADACLDPTVGDNIKDCPSGQSIRPRERDVLQWGYALEFDARKDKVRFGFNHGAASGDGDNEGFGVLDRTPYDSASDKDQELSAFQFDRDYHVDLILFREIIGAVTNAAYFNPYVGYDFIQESDESWGFTFDAIYSLALEPKATPGDDRGLGLEFDLELFIHEYDVFRWSLAYGLLFPFDGFNVLDTQGRVTDEPGVAQTLQMSLGLEF